MMAAQSVRGKTVGRADGVAKVIVALLLGASAEVCLDFDKNKLSQARKKMTAIVMQHHYCQH
jgi:hypothetical protein